jgi:hypothetical protein
LLLLERLDFLDRIALDFLDRFDLAVDVRARPRFWF